MNYCIYFFVGRSDSFRTADGVFGLQNPPETAYLRVFREAIQSPHPDYAKKERNRWLFFSHLFRLRHCFFQ